MTFKMSEEAQTITVYNFRADTQEFIGISDAYIPSHTGLPAYCTDIKPIKVSEGKVAVFDISKSAWYIVDDHRGKTVFDISSGREIYISELGLLPENVTAIAPDGQYQKWDGTAWVKDEEAEKSAELAKAVEQKSRLMQVANDHVAPLQDAVDLDIATDDEKQQLAGWKKYRVMLSRVDCSKPEWPDHPTL
ncbi:MULTISPECIES: tail fiber assembly protein [Serratia]|uniref:tail fiber assembly protein n=1 Tax=Serratia TaxID=613 RepID=UPI000949A94E|nr:tail fiber assembly protein [Serratia sp. 506_PEND]